MGRKDEQVPTNVKLENDSDVNRDAIVVKPLFGKQPIIGKDTQTICQFVNDIRKHYNYGDVNNPVVNFQGFLFFFNILKNRFKRYWCQLRDDFLYVSKHKNDPKKKRIKITYVAFWMIAKQKSFKELLDYPTLGQCRFSLCTPSMNFDHVAALENEAAGWRSAFIGALKFKYSNSVLRAKRKAWKKLERILIQQLHLQKQQFWEKSTPVLKMFIHKDPPYQLVAKEGYLYLLINELKHHKWKKFFVQLSLNFVEFYSLNREKPPLRHCIPLEFIISVGKSPVKNINGRKFVIRTPLRDYSLKATHTVAMEQWIEALSNSSQPNSDVIPNEIHPPGISFRLAEKKSKRIVKIHYLNQNSTTSIGRSPTNKIVISDACVSRNHAKIQCSDREAKFLDMGASGGSKINGEKIKEAKILVNGDKIKLGNTVLVFEAWEASNAFG